MELKLFLVKADVEIQRYLQSGKTEEWTRIVWATSIDDAKERFRNYIARLGSSYDISYSAHHVEVNEAI